MLSPLCFKTLAYVVPVGVTNKASDFLLVLVCTDSGINFICEFALSLVRCGFRVRERLYLGV